MADGTEHAPPDQRRPSQRITGRLTGRQIGPYEQLALLGQGAMGAVYLAEHMDTEARVALKVMGGHLLEDEESLRRFELELAALIKLRHPNVIAVHDAGIMSDGRPWYAMDYVEGDTLRDAQKHGLALEQGLDVLEHMGRALGHAHEQGLVHRDFKPENVLIDADGVPRLTDFGLARTLERDERLTRSEEILGTPRYMAPEQVSKTLGEVGPWSDTWSLGAVLYEVLTGRTPYMGATAVECFAQLTEGQPIPAPRTLSPGVDPGLEAVCLRALARDPAQRFPDGEAFADALAEVRARSGGARTLPVLAALTGLSVLLGAGAILWTLTRAPAAPVAARDVVERRAAAEAAWREGDVLRARRFLADDVDHPDRAWVLALAGDAAQVTDEEAGAVPPRDRAWIAALGGRTEACARALGEIAEPGLRRATAWQLAALLPELPGQAHLPVGDAGGWPGSGWDAQARGEELLLGGRPGLAAAAFATAERGAGSDSVLRLNAQLGLSRSRLARGDLPGALQAVDEAVRGLSASSAASPLERGRLLAWQALLHQAEPLPAAQDKQAELLASQRGRLTELARSCPGLPEAARAVWLGQGGEGEPPGGGRVARAREMACAGQLGPAQELLGGGGGAGSFTRRELAACARGADGEVGLLLARAAELAGLAEGGNARGGARAALDMLGLVGRLEPRSPAAWLARARACLVLHDVGGARQALTRATVLLGGEAAGDGWLLLLRAQVALAELEERRLTLERRRLDEHEPEPDAPGELAVVASLAPVIATLQRAAAADQDLAAEAQLRAGAVRLERLRLMELNEAEAAEEERATLERELLPLIDLPAATGVATARAELARALLDDRGPGVQEAEVRLARAVGAVGLVRLQGMELLAATGHEAATAWLRAAGRDLPARAVLALRRALAASGAERDTWLAHARQLAPDLPLVVLARTRQREVGGDAESYRALAQVLERAPELGGVVLEFLLREAPIAGAAQLAGELEEQGHLLAAALAWRVASRGEDERERPAAHRCWSAASAALAAEAGAVSGGGRAAAAHLLRAVAFDPCPPELQADRERDLLAVRAAAPWEWTAAQLRLKFLPAASEAAIRRERQDELLALGATGATNDLPSGVRDALNRFQPAEAAGASALVGALLDAELGRAALGVAVCTLTPQERVWGLEPEVMTRLLPLLPLERAAAARLLQRPTPPEGERGRWGGPGRGGFGRGFNHRLEEVAWEARAALDQAAPAGLPALLRPEQLTALAAWASQRLPGTPQEPQLWDEARRFGALPGLLALVERALGAEPPRAPLLGLQDPALQGEELERCLQRREDEEAALTWSAVLAFTCDPDLARGGPRLGRWYLPSRGGWWEPDDKRREMVRLAYRVIAASQAHQELPDGPGTQALLADLSLELGASLAESDPERTEWLKRGAKHAQAAPPGQVPGEAAAIGWWRQARGKIASGDEAGARQDMLSGLDAAAGGELRQLGERVRESRTDALDSRLMRLPGVQERVWQRMGDRFRQGGFGPR